MNTEIIAYDVNEEQIAMLAREFAGVTFDTPKSYEQGRRAIARCRELRVAVEKRRKELKAESLEYGRKVDAVAKRYTEALESIEAPMLAAKAVVDAEKERVKREAELAERARIEAELQAKREAEEAKLRAEREAEEQRIAEERRKLDEERAQLEAERQKREETDRVARAKADAEAKAERDQIAAERARLDEERAEIERRRVESDRAEAERQATIRAEQEAKERAERLAIEAKAREAERLEAERRIHEEEDKARARVEALRPDAEKLAAYASALVAVERPTLATEDGQAALSELVRALGEACSRAQRVGGAGLGRRAA